MYEVVAHDRGWNVRTPAGDLVFDHPKSRVAADRRAFLSNAARSAASLESAS